MLSAKTVARERKLGHLSGNPLPYLVLVEKEIQSINHGFTLVQHTTCQRDRWLNMWTAESSLIAADECLGESLDVTCPGTYPPIFPGNSIPALKYKRTIAVMDYSEQWYTHC